jgi:hypothetical protein
VHIVKLVVAAVQHFEQWEVEMDIAFLYLHHQRCELVVVAAQLFHGLRTTHEIGQLVVTTTQYAHTIRTTHQGGNLVVVAIDLLDSRRTAFETGKLVSIADKHGDIGRKGVAYKSSEALIAEIDYGHVVSGTLDDRSNVRLNLPADNGWLIANSRDVPPGRYVPDYAL